MGFMLQDKDVSSSGDEVPYAAASQIPGSDQQRAKQHLVSVHTVATCADFLLTLTAHSSLRGSQWHEGGRRPMT